MKFIDYIQVNNNKNMLKNYNILTYNCFLSCSFLFLKYYTLIHRWIEKTMAMIQCFSLKLWRNLVVISKSGYNELPTKFKFFTIFALVEMLKFMFFERFSTIMFWIS